MGIKRRSAPRTAIDRSRLSPRLLTSKLEAYCATARTRLRNLYAAVRIRDQDTRPAETAADRNVKLRAIASIEGRDATELKRHTQSNKQLSVSSPQAMSFPPASQRLLAPASRRPNHHRRTTRRDNRPRTQQMNDALAVFAPMAIILLVLLALAFVAKGPRKP